MIYLKPELFKALGTIESLRTALQQAVMLEHSTIPTYLYSLYTIKQDSQANSESRRIIKSIVVEEMLHMSLACNILNAVHGSPVIDEPGFIPKYPGPLPGAVESGLIVPLAPFSLPLVENVFMVIEEPEKPLEFPTALEAAPRHTIGEFYDAIKKLIVKLGPGIFTGDPARQLTHGFPPDELIKVTDIPTASHAIDIIVSQGEGAPDTPIDLEGDLAHYYRFAEIFHGHHLVKNPKAGPKTPPDQRFIYNGPPIPFDAAGVFPVMSNPKASGYAPGSAARHANDTFNYTYTGLLKVLHDTFNGTPGKLADAIGMMESLKDQALDIVQIPMGDGTNAGPSFEYQLTNP